MTSSILGIGPTELVVAFWMLMISGSALPTTGVPLPPDDALRSAVPQKCLLYVSHSGTQAADPASTNHVERMLAEPEMQAFWGELSRLVKAGFTKLPANSPQEQALVRGLPPLVQTLLTRPSLMYVEDVQLPPMAPGGQGAIVINAGPQQAALVDVLKEFETLALQSLGIGQPPRNQMVQGGVIRVLPMPPGAPSVAWGTFESFVFVAVGNGHVDALFQRLQAKTGPPEWLKQIEAEAAVPRLNMLAYLNISELIKRFGPLAEQELGPTPTGDSPLELLEKLGLNHLRHLTLASGLDDATIVSKTLLSHDGQFSGLLNFPRSKALSAADLRGVPKQADIAAVVRFDLAATARHGLQLAGQIDANAERAVVDALPQIERQLGFRPVDDLGDGLGDTWTLYHSADEGGALLTGLCVTVNVRDRAKVQKSLDGLLQMLTNLAPVSIRQTTAGNETIHYAQAIGLPVPVTPAWCLTDEQFVFAVSPQMARTHLTRNAASDSLATDEWVVRRLASGDVASVSYANLPMLYRVGYSYLQYMANMGAIMLEKETGVQADVSKIPSYAAIARHLKPSVQVTRVTPTAFVQESFHTGYSFGPLDISTGPAVAGMGVGLLLPAVSSARQRGLETVSMNNLRQLTLAAVVYESERQKLPPRAILSADGKPLLSWRVALLPYLDEQDLYEQFKLDEPWNSPHNRALIAQMPEIYALPGHAESARQGKTVYQMPLGQQTLYGNKYELSSNEFRTINGTRAAIFVETEVERAVVWTQPEDWEVDLQDVTGGLKWNANGNVLIAHGDGSLMFMDPFDDREMRRVLLPRAKPRGAKAD